MLHLRREAPLRDQSNGSKSNILALAHHFEAKATVTNRFWGTTSRLKQRQHIVIGAPLRNQSNGNKLFILALAHQTQDQSNGNSLYILVWGHHFEAKAIANHGIGAPQSNGNESGQHWSTTSRRKQRQHVFALGHHLRSPTQQQQNVPLSIATQRQQIVHLSIGAPLRDQSNGKQILYILAVRHHSVDQSNGNKSYISALGHQFGTKATQQPYILEMGHHFETKATANCTS